MAVYQSRQMSLSHRYRQQVGSYRGIIIAGNKKAPIAGASMFSGSAYMFG